MLQATLFAMFLTQGAAATKSDTATRSVAPQAEVDFTTGEALLTLCEKYEGEVSATVLACASYIQGFLDATSAEDEILTAVPRGAEMCLPKSATYRQHTLVVLKYLRDHPERLHEPRGTLALEALVLAYPCP